MLDGSKMSSVTCPTAKLHVALALGLDLEAEHLRVEVLRPRDVLREEGDEVDALDLHHGLVPSGYGA